MFIEPITCPRCRHKARPGEEGFDLATDNGVHSIACKCGQKIALDNPKDQMVLSTNLFVRLMATSNHIEWGKLEVTPGIRQEFKFNKSIDLVSSLSFTPGAPILVKEYLVEPDGAIILSSLFKAEENPPKSVEVSWVVFGLVNIDSLPAWHLHFYNAIAQTQKRLFRTALVDYAVCFEVFIEQTCFSVLQSKYGNDVANYLLRKTNRIEDRCKELLQLACGFRLSDDQDIYSDWDKFVRNPRNKIAHGELIKVDQAATEKAHLAVYQAIRWIEHKQAGTA